MMRNTHIQPSHIFVRHTHLTFLWNRQKCTWWAASKINQVQKRGPLEISKLCSNFRGQFSLWSFVWECLSAFLPIVMIFGWRMRWESCWEWTKWLLMMKIVQQRSENAQTRLVRSAGTNSLGKDAQMKMVDLKVYEKKGHTYLLREVSSRWIWPVYVKNC